MRVLVVVNAANGATLDAARAIVAWLASEGHDPIVPALDAEAASLQEHAAPAAEVGAADLAVALGGDGTILKAVHLLGSTDAPVLGVNLGRLGFLSGAQGAEALEAVRRALSGEGTLERRCTVSAEVTMSGRRTGTYRALNEVFVGRGTGMRAVEAEVSVDDQPLARMVCDGVIVATPTGSTAYALSAGGPLLAPEVRGMAIVPVSPHTLCCRPVVTGPDARVTLTFPDGSRPAGCLTVDGDAVPCRSAVEQVDVGLDARDVTLVRLDGARFYENLRRSFF